MTADTIEILVWAFNAFWLWLMLAGLLRRLGLPLSQVSAAVLGWVCAGALLPWTLPVAEHWLGRFPGMFHWLLAVL